MADIMYRETNISTGRSRDVIADDVWILENMGKTVELSITSTNVSVGSVETLSLQMYTPYLTDDSRNIIQEEIEMELVVGDIEVRITTDSLGQWSDTVNFVSTGEYQINCSDLSSNILIITVT